MLRLELLARVIQKASNVHGDRKRLRGPKLASKAVVGDLNRWKLELADLVGGNSQHELERTTPVPQIAPQTIAVISIENLELAEIRPARQTNRDSIFADRAHRKNQSIAHMRFGVIE